MGEGHEELTAADREDDGGRPNGHGRSEGVGMDPGRGPSDDRAASAAARPDRKV